MKRYLAAIIATSVLTFAGCSQFERWEENATQEELDSAASAAEAGAAAATAVGTAAGPIGLIVAAPIATGLALLAARLRRRSKQETTNADA